MRCFEYRSEVWLASPIEKVFSFFTDVQNLQALTPGWLNFSILTPGTVVLQPGALLDYKLKVHGMPVHWRSEITVWEPPRRFVDEQRRGPYALWIHEHRFEVRNGGTLARDFVRYAVPGGWLVNQLVVRRDLDKIFKFRHEKLLTLFGGP